MREAIYEPTTMPLGESARDRRSENSPSDIMTFLWDLWMVTRLRGLSPYCGPSGERSISAADWLIAFQIWAGYRVLVANFAFLVAVVVEDRVSALDGCP